jgi:hypothetical protein
MKFSFKTNCLPFILLCSSTVLADNLYKWVDNHGNTHYGDAPPAENSLQVEEVALPPLNSFENIPPINTDINDIKAEVRVDIQEKFALQTKKKVILEHTAIECFDPSPSSNGTPLIRKKVTAAQHKSLRLSLEKMVGSWRGDALYSECKGQINAPIIEKDQYSVSTDIRLKRFKELTIKFEMYSAEKRATTNESIELFLTDEHLSLSHHLSDETVLLNATNNRIELWVENFPTAGVRNELVRIFELQNKKFTINQFQYVNGTLASIMQWNLERF